MTLDVASIAPTVLIAQARVGAVERLSSAFVRVTLQCPAFVDLGREGFDTRFKLVFPGPTGLLPALPGCPAQWYDAWRAMPDPLRSPMRTYTVRDVVDADGLRLLVVDLVVHRHGPQGPACRWALQARVGDELQVVAPHRGSRAYGGTEFAPGGRNTLLLAADETAVPALSRILADLGPGWSGRAFAEVPSAGDIPALDVPEGIELTWLVRGPSRHGRRLVHEVRHHLGLGPSGCPEPDAEPAGTLDVEVWETPRHSASGEDVEAVAHRGTTRSNLQDLYAWIAGESWLVKALRRALVTELHVPRHQVAFMGYWREGVPMKS